MVSSDKIRETLYTKIRDLQKENAQLRSSIKTLEDVCDRLDKKLSRELITNFELKRKLDVISMDYYKTTYKEPTL